MIMVCQGRNIPLSFSVELLFSTKSICVIIFPCLSAPYLSREAGEYFSKFTRSRRESCGLVDLSYFRKMAYRRALNIRIFYINDKYVSSDSLTFQEISHDAGATASPCLSAEYLNSWLINTTAYPQLFEAGETCARLSAIPG